jgi:hypothetical protein
MYEINELLIKFINNLQRQSRPTRNQIVERLGVRIFVQIIGMLHGFILFYSA